MDEMTVTATIARHLDELGDRYQPLESFVDAVIAELEGDYWPAPHTFDDAAWDRAKAEYDRLQLADLAELGR